MKIKEKRAMDCANSIDRLKAIAARISDTYADGGGGESAPPG